MLKKLTTKTVSLREKMLKEKYAQINLCADACTLSCGGLGPKEDVKNELFREKA